MKEYKKDYKAMLLELLGDGTALHLGLSNFYCTEYVEVFAFPKKAITYELGRLLLHNSYETAEKCEIKFTSEVFKGLVNGLGKYRKGLFEREKLLRIAEKHGCNLGYAFEYLYKEQGFFKTDSYTDNILKIDVTKGRSKIQLKCSVIQDDNKKAYPSVNSLTLTK